MGCSLPIFRNPLPSVLFCALLWGSAFPVIKRVYGTWEDLGVERSLAMIFLFAGVRFSIAGAGLLLFGKGLRNEIRRTRWALILGFAIAQTFVQYVFFYQAIAVSSGSLAALMVATGSFWWMLLSPILPLATPPLASRSLSSAFSSTTTRSAHRRRMR